MCSAKDGFEESARSGFVYLRGVDVSLNGS